MSGLWDEAGDISLGSCERGARSSREAAGIHLYLRQARSDPRKKPPVSFAGGPWRLACTASPAGWSLAGEWEHRALVGLAPVPMVPAGTVPVGIAPTVAAAAEAEAAVQNVAEAPADDAPPGAAAEKTGRPASEGHASGEAWAKPSGELSAQMLALCTGR